MCSCSDPCKNLAHSVRCACMIARQPETRQKRRAPSHHITTHDDKPSRTHSSALSLRHRVLFTSHALLLHAALHTVQITLVAAVAKVIISKSRWPLLSELNCPTTSSLRQNHASGRHRKNVCFGLDASFLCVRARFTRHVFDSFSPLDLILERQHLHRCATTTSNKKNKREQ